MEIEPRKSEKQETDMAETEHREKSESKLAKDEKGVVGALETSAYTEVLKTKIEENVMDAKKVEENWLKQVGEFRKEREQMHQENADMEKKSADPWKEKMAKLVEEMPGQQEEKITDEVDRKDYEQDMANKQVEIDEIKHYSLCMAAMAGMIQTAAQGHFDVVITSVDKMLAELRQKDYEEDSYCNFPITPATLAWPTRP